MSGRKLLASGKVISVNRAELLNRRVLKGIRNLNYKNIVLHLRRNSTDALAAMVNKDECYGLWLQSLVNLVKPKQVVELGAGWGNSTIMIGMAMPKDSKFFSVDLGVLQPQWGNIDRYYPSLVRIPGDDLDISLFPKGTKLEETDIWYIDSEHTATHFMKELELYSPFFKKGTIVVCDDIHLNNMELVWNKLPYDKCDLSFPCRPDSGFGMFCT